MKVCKIIIHTYTIAQTIYPNKCHRNRRSVIVHTTTIRLTSRQDIPFITEHIHQKQANSSDGKRTTKGKRTRNDAATKQFTDWYNAFFCCKEQL